MLLLLFAGSQGASAQLPVDARDILTELYPQLAASGASDLVYWTEDELYRYVDDAGKRLARNVGCFVQRDTSLTAQVGVAEYADPERHLSTIHVSLADESLREATVQELEAESDAWALDSGSPDRWLQLRGQNTLRLYRQPDAGADGDAIAIIEHVFPADVDAAAPELDVPLVLRDYFRFHAEAAARGKESKAAMPEVSQWLRQLTDMYENVARTYWGTAQ